MEKIAEAVKASPLVSRALDIAGEGGEEALSTVLTPYLQRAIYDPDAPNATPEEIAQSALMGAVAAGVLQGGLEPGRFPMRPRISIPPGAALVPTRRSRPGPGNG